MASKHEQRQVETEIKYSLSKSDYLKLKKHLKKFSHQEKKQINYYFDTPQLNLKKQKIGLRIRFENSNQAITALKFPKKTSLKSIAGLKVRHEVEAKTPLKVAKVICQNRKSILCLNLLPINTLKKKTSPSELIHLGCLGKLTNHRTAYHYEKKCLIELDRSIFFKKTFYELEVETTTPDETNKVIKNLFKSLAIKTCPGKVSKLQRFLQEFKKQKKTA